MFFWVRCCRTVFSLQAFETPIYEKLAAARHASSCNGLFLPRWKMLAWEKKFGFSLEKGEMNDTMQEKCIFHTTVKKVIVLCTILICFKGPNLSNNGKLWNPWLEFACICKCWGKPGLKYRNGTVHKFLEHPSKSDCWNVQLYERWNSCLRRRPLGTTFMSSQFTLLLSYKLTSHSGCSHISMPHFSCHFLM